MGSTDSAAEKRGSLVCSGQNGESLHLQTAQQLQRREKEEMSRMRMYDGRVVSRLTIWSK